VDDSVKFVLFTLSGLKMKVGGLRVKFVKCTTPSQFNQIIIINDHHTYT